MRSSLGLFPLRNRHSGAIEDAELFVPIDGTNLADFEQHWKPMVLDRLRQLPRGTTTTDAQLQDWHWDWRKKADRFADRLDYRSFAVECAGRTQGLMICSLVHRVREPSMLNQHLVYIEFLHSAPWNRWQFTDTPLYKGVGDLLVAAAVSLSIEEEFEGRIGLHSLPQSDDWYRDYCGMTDLGVDSAYENLRYFEMTAQQAANFGRKNPKGVAS